MSVPEATPKLAVFFARWLDVKFVVFCDMVIDDILSKKAELTITKPAESMAMKVPQSFPEALRLAAERAEQNEKLSVENKVMHEELNSVTLDESCAVSPLSHTRLPSKIDENRLGRTYGEEKFFIRLAKQQEGSSSRNTQGEQPEGDLCVPLL